MDADIHTRYHSDLYRMLDFKCRCTDYRTSKPEYAESFCISFEFTHSFHQELTQRYGHTKFFRDNDLHSTLLRTDK